MRAAESSPSLHERVPESVLAHGLGLFKYPPGESLLDKPEHRLVVVAAQFNEQRVVELAAGAADSCNRSFASGDSRSRR